MLSERLQILISEEQRDRLRAESRSRNVSVGELVRAAIDKEYSGPTREEKRRAWEKVKAMRGRGPELSPEKLDRIVERGIEDRARRAGIDIPARD